MIRIVNIGRFKAPERVRRLLLRRSESTWPSLRNWISTRTEAFRPTWSPASAIVDWFRRWGWHVRRSSDAISTVRLPEPRSGRPGRRHSLLWSTKHKLRSCSAHPSAGKRRSAANWWQLEVNRLSASKWWSSALHSRHELPIVAIIFVIKSNNVLDGSWENVRVLRRLSAAVRVTEVSRWRPMSSSRGSDGAGTTSSDPASWCTNAALLNEMPKHF